MDADEVEAALRGGDRGRRKDVLDELFLMFEAYYLYVEDRIRIIQMLMDRMVEESDPKMVVLEFDVICAGICSPMMEREDESLLDYSGIAGALDRADDPVTISNLIFLLSLSQDKRYADRILRFRDSGDRRVRSAVERAIIEMRL